MIAGIIGCVLALSAGLASGQNQPFGELLTAAQVRALTPEQAAQHLPVHLKGVITFFDDNLFSRFVQDETAGIYFLDLPTNMPGLKPGLLVEMMGVTSPGEYAPIVIPSSITVLGEAALPVARPVTAEQLASGREDSQLVEISGIVRSVRFEQETMQYLIDLVMNGERFTAHARQLPVAQPEMLVDSIVKVHGVCSTLFNRQRQLFGFRLLLPSTNDLVIEQAARENPFNIPAQDPASLLRFTPQGSSGHRVKLAGVVAYFEPGSAVFIESANAGVYCQTRERTPLKLGDRVEVLGFPAKGEYAPVLEDATYRKVGEATAPVPALLDTDEVLTGTNDCQLIQINAQLVERTQRGKEQFLVLNTNGFTFNAYLAQGADNKNLETLQKGSVVQVSGICLIERGSNWRAGEGWRAKSFRLLLRSPDDVVLLSAPPVWVQWGPLRIVGTLSIVILLALLWILILQRRIAAHQAAKP